MPPRKRAAAASSAGEPASKRADVDEPHATLTGGNKTQSKMAQFWREGKFCDVSICVDGQEFPAHRVVLAAGSEMLAALSDGERFADSASSKIQLTDMSAAAVEVVLRYLYDGTVDCAVSLLTEVGAAASFLQVAPLIEHTGSALMAGLSATNCVRIWSYAKQYSVDALVAQCRERAASDFQTLTDVEKVPPEEMSSLLERDDLVVDDEEQVYAAAVRFARARQPPLSDTALASFFSTVRFPLLKQTTFHTMVMHEPLLAGVECKGMLARAYAAHVYGPQIVPRGNKPAEAAKARGLSAVEAKALGLPGIEIFALCRHLNVYRAGGARFAKEGDEVVLDDGKFGKLYAKDRDNQAPWYVMLDGSAQPTREYLQDLVFGPGSSLIKRAARYARFRSLEWA